MRKAVITQAKNRGRPIARLEAVTVGDEGEPDGRPARLVGEGLVRQRRNPPPLTLFSSAPPHASSGASAVEALIEERREAR